MHPNEQGDTCAGFLTRALAWFAAHDVTVERVIPDNAPNYRRSRAFQQVMTDAGIRHLRTRPYRPQTNGKAERFNQTLLHEWAYETTWTTNPPATLSAPSLPHSRAASISGVRARTEGDGLRRLTLAVGQAVGGRHPQALGGYEHHGEHRVPRQVAHDLAG